MTSVRGRCSCLSLVAIAAVAVCASLPLLMGDAVRGQGLFHSQGCVSCHSLNGEGGKTAPDLGAGAGRGFSPAGLAALMWNHAPRMWAAVSKQGAARPELSEQQAADLFAYFYAARYFDLPGDSKRGRALFGEKRCADCHAGPAPGPGGAPPVSAWESLRDPIALAQHLWNHSARMVQAMAQKRIPYPELTAEDLADLAAHVRRLSRPAELLPAAPVGSAETGAKVFQQKRCAACHIGSFDLKTRRTRFSLTDFAASLWNHAPRIPGNRPALDAQEMRDIVAYLGALQYFEEYGNIDRGRKVFTKKKCAACHAESASGAPDLSGKAGTISSYQMVTVLWKHGPAMLEAMRGRKIDWPRFTGTEMSDLVTFLHGPRLKRR